jgi:hypothetical protein
MENNIDIKNKKLIIFSLILVLLICCLLVSNNKKRQTKKLKRKVDKIFKSDSFITVPNNTCGDYNLTYGELNWEGMENISKYMELKDWSKNTFIDLGSGNGRTLAYAILNGFKEAKGTELVQANKKLDQKLGNIVEPDQDALKQASNQNPEYDDTTTNTDLHIQHKTGESGINPQDDQQMDDYADAVTSAVLDDGMDVDVDVESGVSKQADKFSNVSKSGGKLDQERNDEAEKQITDKLEKSFKDKGAKVTKTGDEIKIEKDLLTEYFKIRLDQFTDFKLTSLLFNLNTNK